jgi:hypothetical protein
MDDRPRVWCIVGYEWECGRDRGCRSLPALLDADDARKLGLMGWTVIVDRFAMEDLARWNQLQQAPKRRISW